MRVAEIMKREPYVVHPTDPIQRAWYMLSEADVRHLPVVNDGVLVGMLSDRDLRPILPTALEEVEDPAGVRQLLAQPVSNVMSSDVISFKEEDDVADVIDSMLELRIGAVPIVGLDGTELVGIVSSVDILRAARDTL